MIGQIRFGIRILTTAALGSVLGACDGGSSKDVSPQEPARTAPNECMTKGEAYFREIGSWPTLSDGRDAIEVVADRCSRTTGAFDGLD